MGAYLGNNIQFRVFGQVITMTFVGLRQQQTVLLNIIL